MLKFILINNITKIQSEYVYIKYTYFFYTLIKIFFVIEKKCKNRDCCLLIYFYFSKILFFNRIFKIK